MAQQGTRRRTILKSWTHEYEAQVKREAVASLLARQEQLLNNTGATDAMSDVQKARKEGQEVAMDFIKDDISRSFKEALDRRLRFTEITKDAKVAAKVPESFFLARVWPALARVAAPVHQHRHKGSWASPTFEHTVVFELKSTAALVATIGDIWGPRKWCSVKLTNYNDDPTRGPIEAGCHRFERATSIRSLFRYECY